MNYPKLEDFIYDLDGKTLATKESYSRTLKGFFKWVSAHKIQEVTKADIKAYIGQRELSPKSVSMYLSAIRAYFDYCVKEGIIPENPAKTIKGPRIHKGHLKEGLTVEEVKSLIRSIDKSSLIGKRDFAFIYLMLKCGLREIEVIRANIEDLRPKGSEKVLYVQGKAWSSKNDFVIVLPKVYKVIDTYLRHRKTASTKEALFASCGNRSRGRLSTRAIRERVNCYLTKAGIKRKTITAHSLRHTCATLALEAGAPIFEVKNMLRHSKIETTMIYAHEVNRIKNGAERYIRQI